MPDEPLVLQRLKALGLTQKEIAAKLGASPAAVSMWCSGKNPFPEPYRTEAEALLAVTQEHLTQGGTPPTAPFRPTVFMNPGGTTRGGEFPMPPEAVNDLMELQRRMQGLPPEVQMARLWAFHACVIAYVLYGELTPIDPETWQPSATTLDDLRRMVKALELSLDGLLHLKAQAALQREHPHADETP